MDSSGCYANSILRIRFVRSSFYSINGPTKKSACCVKMDNLGFSIFLVNGAGPASSHAKKHSHNKGKVRNLTPVRVATDNDDWIMEEAFIHNRHRFVLFKSEIS